MQVSYFHPPSIPKLSCESGRHANCYEYQQQKCLCQKFYIFNLPIYQTLIPYQSIYCLKCQRQCAVKNKIKFEKANKLFEEFKHFNYYYLENNLNYLAHIVKDKLLFQSGRISKKLKKIMLPLRKSSDMITKEYLSQENIIYQNFNFYCQNRKVLKSLSLQNFHSQMIQQNSKKGINQYSLVFLKINPIKEIQVDMISYSTVGYSFSGIDDNDPIVAVVIKHQQFLTIWIYDYKSGLLKSKNETIVLKYLYDDLQIKFSSKNKKLVILIGSSYLIYDITLDITQINQIDNYKKFCFLVKAKDVLMLIQQNGLFEFQDQTSKFNFKSSNLMFSNIDKNKDFQWYYHQSRQAIILQNAQKLFFISMKSSKQIHFFRRILHTKHDQYFIDQFTMTEQSELFVYVSRSFKNVNILLHSLQAKKLIRNFSLLWNQSLINEKTQILCSSQSSTLIFIQKYDVNIINLKTGKVILFLKSDMKNRNHTQPIKIFDGLTFLAQNQTIKVWKLQMNEKHKND